MSLYAELSNLKVQLNDSLSAEMEADGSVMLWEVDKNNRRNITESICKEELLIFYEWLKSIMEDK